MSLPVGAHAGNTGGKPGRSGRKPIEFKAECERLVDDLVLPKLSVYLAHHDPGDGGFRWATEFAAQYGKGRPKQAFEVSGALPQLEGTGEDAMRRIQQQVLGMLPFFKLSRDELDEAKARLENMARFEVALSSPRSSGGSGGK